MDHALMWADVVDVTYNYGNGVPSLPCPIKCPISHPAESLLLHDVAAKGHLETTKFLVTKKGQGPSDSDADGNAPLHHAAYSDRLVMT